MVIELTAARALAPLFGTSLYVWTNVIGVVLLALAAGYWIGGQLADRRPEAALLGRLVLVAAALTVPAPFLAVPLGTWLMPEPEALSPLVTTGHVVRGSLAATLVLFAPPLFLLGMVGPFVTRCLVDLGFNGGQAAGQTLAVSTLGSLFGTYLPAHLLIEHLGVRATLLSASGLLLVAAIVLMLPGRRATTPAALLLIVVGLVVWTPGLPVRDVIDAGSLGEEVEIVEELETAYQYVRVSRWRIGEGEDAVSELRLSLDEGATEFHSVLRMDQVLTGYYYDYFALLPELFQQRATRPLDVVIIGGGAGTMPRQLRKLHPDTLRRIVSVEIDPGVAALAATFDWSPGVNDLSVVADGRWMLATVDHRFDLVILDAYARQVAVPPHLGTVEFFELVKKRLTPRGIFAMNVSTHDLGSPLFRALSRTVMEVFPSTAAVSVPGSWNVVLLAAAEPGRSFRPDRASKELQGVLSAFRSGLIPLPDPGDGAVLLVDDKAPLEQLARQR